MTNLSPVKYRNPNTKLQQQCGRGDKCSATARDPDIPPLVTTTYSIHKKIC